MPQWKAITRGVLAIALNVMAIIQLSELRTMSGFAQVASGYSTHLSVVSGAMNQILAIWSIAMLLAATIVMAWPDGTGMTEGRLGITIP